MMLDLAERLVVIVGGGFVAARKARGLLECGATRVRCVAPEFHAGVPATVERIIGRYESRHLEGAGLAFAATSDPAVNAAVLRDARARGIFVNRAGKVDAGSGATDAEHPGDFTTPSYFRQSPFTVTVAAGGNPAVAALVRRRLETLWDPTWTRLAAAVAALRPTVLGAGDLGEDWRRRIMTWLCSEEALATLADVPPDGGIEGDVRALRAWVARTLRDIMSGSEDANTVATAERDEDRRSATLALRHIEHG